MMRYDDVQSFERIAAFLDAARRVAVVGHTDPDGDALGSVLAMTAIIERRWPHVLVQPLLANDRPVDGAYLFLPGVRRFVPAVRYDGVPDLLISVDTPMPSRLADAQAVLLRAKATAAFDHHPTMEPFAQVNVLHADAAAAGVIVHDFMEYAGVVPTRDIATCILTAVMTDTGRFQYQNTDAHALRVAAAMLEAGGSTVEVATNVYQSFSPAALSLKGMVLSRLSTDATGEVAFSYVTARDMRDVGAAPGDCESLIDDVRSLAGTKACLFMREQPDGSLRGNLRAKVEWLDVSAVAQRFGGGGHRAAAGFTTEGPLETALARAVGALVDRIAGDGPSGEGRCCV